MNYDDLWPYKKVVYDFLNFVDFGPDDEQVICDFTKVVSSGHIGM